MIRHLALPALLAAALWSSPGPARAQEPPDTRGDTVRYAFEDEAVLGDTVSPNGEIMAVRKRPTRHSLVRAREGFVPELLRSVEAL